MDFRFKTISVDSKTIKLQIWDTAGQERFRKITTSYLKGAQGIMIVFSVCSRRSFELCGTWLADMRRHLLQAMDSARPHAQPKFASSVLIATTSTLTRNRPSEISFVDAALDLGAPSTPVES